ncbi:MAG: hypothetical protein JOY54_10095 [Acidobacteriaceae bacterium]|nr:hypothetical protein [Acidobacteriaceae bacterium]
MRTVSRSLFLLSAVGLLALAAPDPAGYVGSKTCFGCHQDIYRSFTQTDMGHSMRLLSELDTSSFLRESTVPVGSSGRILRVFQEQNAWHQSETEPNVFLEEHKLEYAVGSGANGFTFLIRRGNYLFQAPLSFYSKIGKWDLSPGYETVDLGFTRAAPEACLACHSGRARPVPRRNGEYLDPPFEELSIGCENCHGPGASHVNALGRKPGEIVNPAKLPARLAEDICMNCHQRGDTRVLQPGKRFADFRPGEPLFQTLAIFKVPAASGGREGDDLLEHDAAMKASRCFRSSGGKLSCFTCHDPHVQPRGAQAVSFFRAKCLTCHTDASCRLPRSVRLEKNPPDDCIGCHMPKRSVALISHSALTNHRIPASADSRVPESTPESDNGLILIDRPYGQNPSVPPLTLLRAYAELAPRFPAYQNSYLALLLHLSQTDAKDPFVQAALGHKALAEGNNEQALAYLSAALPLEDPTVYLDIAKAASNLSHSDEALAYLKSGVEADPFNPTLQKTLILEYINLKRYAEAHQAMEQYVNSFPGDTFMRNLLSRVSN